MVLEASSQALAQKRLYGIQFVVGIFTNLTQDHLDYHGNMQNYYEAKKILFNNCLNTLINIDDDYGKKLFSELDLETIKTFSCKTSTANFSVQNAKLSLIGVRFAFLGDGFLCPASYAIPGGYSVQNALSALSCAVMLGINPHYAAVALSEIKGVPGRSEVIYAKEFSVIIDFAHTPDALEKLLSSFRPFVQGKMVVVFGNAGQRDAAKREQMGEVAAKYADEIIITADNPRQESVENTIAGSLDAIKKSGKKYAIEPDREKAVIQALQCLTDGDICLLCGKGHEDYQVYADKTIYLCEKEIVYSWLKKEQRL
jgi:UDP-N-acetylmuramoyl-L-alanyl-D-glutamate--2,6-diaminopimelate ligase